MCNVIESQDSEIRKRNHLTKVVIDLVNCIYFICDEQTLLYVLSSLHECTKQENLTASYLTHVEYLEAGIYEYEFEGETINDSSTSQSCEA